MSDETTQNSNVIKAEPVTPVPAVQLELLQIILKAILSEPAKYILIHMHPMANELRACPVIFRRNSASFGGIRRNRFKDFSSFRALFAVV
jgi:hypothetical protein